MNANLLFPLSGGILIGLAAGVFMLSNGRIAGISGIGIELIARRNGRRLQNIAFIAGLPSGLAVWNLSGAGTVEVHLTHSVALLAFSGFLVGIGTRLANGCTSGHGVCGLARLSPRSLVATGLFMTTAIITFALEQALS